MINEYVRSGQMARALQFAFRPRVFNTNLPTVLGPNCPNEDYTISAIVLSVKNPKIDTKGLRNNKSKPVPYHRLCLCRDLDSGLDFYFLTKDQPTTDSIFPLFKNIPLIGQTVRVYEPTYDDTKILDIPLVTIKEALTPATIPFDNFLLSDVVTDPGANLIKSFLISTPSLELSKAKYMTSCPSSLCDSSHDMNALCPATTTPSASTSRKALLVEVTVPGQHITQVPFRSAELCRLFMTEATLANDAVDIDDVKDVIENILNLYEQAGINFLIAGWYKRLLEDNTRKFHISCLKPQHILEDAPLYNCPPAEAAEMPGAPAMQRAGAGRRWIDLNRNQPPAAPSAGPAVRPRAGAAIGQRAGAAIGQRAGAAIGQRAGAAIGPRAGPAVQPQAEPAVQPQAGPAVQPQERPAVPLQERPEVQPEEIPTIQQEEDTSPTTQASPRHASKRLRK